MTGPLKLLYVVNDGPFFLSHRLPLALAAREAGYEVHVATPPGAAAAEIQAQGLAYHPITLVRSGTRPVQEIASFLDLLRLYRRLRPGIVHHVTIKPTLYGGVAARLAGVPAVVSAVTGLGYLFVSRNAKTVLLRRSVTSAYRLALRHPRSRVIFQNPDDLAFFEERRLIRPRQAVLIRGSGVDMAAFAPGAAPAGPPVVLLAARMLWDKGVGEFMEAARTLRGKGVAARFALAGDTDPANPAAVPPSRLEAWRASGLVEWWGHRTDMAEAFNGAHVVCLPSYREGLPKVLIEAAACGRPLVTTDAPGCREIVQHGVNGLLVPVGDAAALAAALQRLIDDPALRQRMGEAGRELAAKEFSLDKVIGETLTVYRDLLC